MTFQPSTHIQSHQDLYLDPGMCVAAMVSTFVFRPAPRWVGMCVFAPAPTWERAGSWRAMIRRLLGERIDLILRLAAHGAGRATGHTDHFDS